MPLSSLVDTHCHIQSVGLEGGEPNTQALWEKLQDRDPDIMIEAAASEGVTKLICVGCDLPDSQLAVRFVKDRPNCWASIGIHPHEAGHYVHDQAKQTSFASLAKSPKVVAIGECGLDYFYEHSKKDDQIVILEFQLKLARTHNLPVIFHVRDALSDFWPIFDRYSTAERPLRGVLHSFTDTADNLEKALQRGLYVGVNGIATFTKSEEQRSMYRAIPLDRLLLETDAPFLTPTPYRGNINESKYIRVIAEFIAKLRGEPYTEIADCSTRNATTLFGLK